MFACFLRYTVTMLNAIFTIFWGLLLLTIIVCIHELGHFSVARLFKLRVKEFMIGLPGPRISFKRKETRYGITAIPLGGYCMIAGMERGKDTNDLEKALAFIGYFGEVADVQAERAGEQLGFDLVTALDTLNDWGTVRRFKQGGLYRYTLSEACVDGVKYKEGEQRHYVDLSSYLASERKLLYSSLPWWKRMLILFAGSFFNLVAAVTILLVLLMVGGAQHTTTTDRKSVV